MKRVTPADLPSPLRDIRLVIWDLDGTLWSGVLSEGEPTRIPRREELVRRLTLAGVINSVASNNDHAAASSMLESIGIVDELVFVELSWGPKAPMVERIVSSTRLQRTQVLFVDDNPRLRAEVATQCGIAVADPRELDDIDPVTIPVTDPRRERLARYRTMERRDQIARQAGSLSARDFLRTCDLRVSLLEPSAEKARLVELAARANQLNFTKRPLTTADLDGLIADPNVEVRAIAARDRFGSYGTVGLYALDHPGHALVHFVFSCRLLNTWVEHAVYQHLGSPDILADPGGAAAHLAREDAIDWVIIEEGPSSLETQEKDHVGHALEVVLIGGCDLETMATYISIDHDLAASWHVPQVIDGVRCELQSSLLLLDPEAALHAEALDRFPPLANWRPPPAVANADLVVLSLWAELTTTRLRHRLNGWCIPWLVGAPPPEAGAGAPSPAPGHLEDLGPLPVPEVGTLVTRFAASLRSGARLAVVNLPQLDRGPMGRRARALNEVLDALAGDRVIDLIDLRAEVRGPDDLADDGVATHYARPVYARVAAQIRRTASATRTDDPSS